MLFSKSWGHLHSKLYELGPCHFQRMFTSLHVSHDACHMSHVTCHMLHVNCHLLRVKCHIYFFFCRTKWWSQSVEGLLSMGPIHIVYSFVLFSWRHFKLSIKLQVLKTLVSYVRNKNVHPFVCLPLRPSVHLSVWFVLPPAWRVGYICIKLRYLLYGK